MNYALLFATALSLAVLARIADADSQVKVDVGGFQDVVEKRPYGGNIDYKSCSSNPKLIVQSASVSPFPIKYNAKVHADVVVNVLEEIKGGDIIFSTRILFKNIVEKQNLCDIVKCPLQPGIQHFTFDSDVPDYFISLKLNVKLELKEGSNTDACVTTEVELGSIPPLENKEIRVYSKDRLNDVYRF